MRSIVFICTILSLLFIVSSCQKQQPEPVAQQQETTEQQESPEPPANVQSNMVPIPLELPKPMFVGTPENIEGVENLMKPLGKARPPFPAPEGTKVISRDKSVTGSEDFPIIGEYSWIVDGDKNASEGSLVEMGPFKQWITIDLEGKYEIYAIVVWHYHKTARVYFDVVVQIGSDSEFVTDVATVFNNDLDNSAGLGVGQDMHYVETAEGKLIDAKGTIGQYVRLYSGGNHANDMNHYVEVEVFGREVQ